MDTCKILLLTFLIYFLLQCAENVPAGQDGFSNEAAAAIPETSANKWEGIAKKSIEAKMAPRIEARAKNLVLMIGDGMGLTTVTASRIYKGQQEGLPIGEEGELSFEGYPYTGTAKTYCNDVLVADSACSTTAYSCGAKTNVRTIGVSANVLQKNCTASMMRENHVQSVLHWAQLQGKSTGIVTTTAITDASPAGSYAHVASRDWEDDGSVKNDGYNPDNCIDIARQLIESEPGKYINVILGGGRQHFLPNTAKFGGRRTDSKNLIEDWRQDKKNAIYVEGRNEFLNLKLENVDFLLGLFAQGDLEYVENMEQANQPTLPEMVAAAVSILSRNPKGFYLFVESGKIDHAHHANNAKRALLETLELDKTAKLIDDETNDEDTLIVVSADHSHLLTIAGDPPIGNPILGLTGNTNIGDGLPATTLSYINGPGYRQPIGPKCNRPDISKDNLHDIDYRQISSYPKASASHAGEDVLIYAKGPFSHLFTGVNDQTLIAHAMKHAANFGVKDSLNRANKMEKTQISIGSFLTGILGYFQ